MDEDIDEVAKPLLQLPASKFITTKNTTTSMGIVITTMEQTTFGFCWIIFVTHVNVFDCSRCHSEWVDVHQIILSITSKKIIEKYYSQIYYLWTSKTNSYQQ